ncbi:MAG: hypothetical protein AB7I36_21195 [Rhodospirillaceae bacterium]
MAARRHWAKDVETSVLLRSRRRCAFCVGLDGDTTEKEGQIAHVDRDSQNASLENAAWLCTKHHSRYDSRSRQTKGHTPAELRAYLQILYEYTASPATWPDSGGKRTKGPGVSLEVFDRRLPIYAATIAFIREAVKGGKFDLQPIWDFANATEQALFLFDDDLAGYLSTLYRQGVRLHAVSVMLEAPERRTSELIQEETGLLLWFSEQFEETRRRFVRYLRLSSHAG